jgi:hypothetical protein
MAKSPGEGDHYQRMISEPRLGVSVCERSCLSLRRIEQNGYI